MEAERVSLDEQQHRTNSPSMSVRRRLSESSIGLGLFTFVYPAVFDVLHSDALRLPTISEPHPTSDSSTVSVSFRLGVALIQGRAENGAIEQFYCPVMQLVAI